MNSNYTHEKAEILSIQNISRDENFTLHEQHVPGYNLSPQLIGFQAIIFVLIVTIGNFLLFCMIIYEKYGMDAQKRTVTNQLLSSICGNLIVFNSIFMTILTINNFGLESKTFKSTYNNYRC